MIINKMERDLILNNSLIKYLLWQKSHLGKGIDGIKDINDLRLFLMGYGKACDENNIINPLWYFWIWTETKLMNIKDSSEDYFSFINRTNIDSDEGLLKFYSLLEEFITVFNANDKIYKSDTT
jgi:hypothetical protein